MSRREFEMSWKFTPSTSMFVRVLPLVPPASHMPAALLPASKLWIAPPMIEMFEPPFKKTSAVVSMFRNVM